MRPYLILLLACLTQCAERKVYVGMLQPASGTCDPPGRATLTVRGHTVEFAPSSGVLILLGKLADGGQIMASMTRPGADKRLYHTRLQATLTDGQVTGEYISPRCRYTVHLRRD